MIKKHKQTVVIITIIVSALILVYIGKTILGGSYITEMYYGNYSSIPKYLDIGTNYTIPITIKNLENQDVYYTYKTTIEIDNGKPLIVSERNFSLGNKEEKIVFEVIKIDRLFYISKIQSSIEHLNKTQEIHFFVKGTKND